MLTDANGKEIERLTAERDEARKHLRKANDQTEEYERKYYLELNKTEDLTSELAALKSAPGMQEVDALFDAWSGADSQVVGKLFNLARRSIASRDEVVGLLNHILSCIITVRRENTPEWMEWIVEEINKVNEAIGDPDRVALSLGNIVIVKGK